MSPVAVITDTYGSLPALDAALERIEELGVEQVYCGGDLVGYGPWPNEVCRSIEERAIPTIYARRSSARQARDRARRGRRTQTGSTRSAPTAQRTRGGWRGSYRR